MVIGIHLFVIISKLKKSFTYDVCFSEFSVDSLFLVTLREHDNPVIHGGVVPWDTDDINPGGHFDFSLHAYVAPVNGYYQ